MSCCIPGPIELSTLKMHWNLKRLSSIFCLQRFMIYSQRINCHALLLGRLC